MFNCRKNLIFVADDLPEDYAAQHNKCPKCGSDHIQKQYWNGYTIKTGDLPNFKDYSDASCKDCGWKGIVDELKA